MLSADSRTMGGNFGATETLEVFVKRVVREGYLRRLAASE
jgi:hypothetical protein